MRLHALGLLSDNDKLALFKRRSARWGSRSEPGHDKWTPEKPRLLRRTLELLIGAGVLSAEGIPRYLGLFPRDVEKLCGLRDSYFSAPPEVIDMATLRAAKIQSEVSRQTSFGVATSGAVLNFKK